MCPDKNCPSHRIVTAGVVALAVIFALLVAGMIETARLSRQINHHVKKLDVPTALDPLRMRTDAEDWLNRSQLQAISPVIDDCPCHKKEKAKKK